MNRNMSIALLLAASITVPVGAQAIPAQRSSSAPVVVKTPARSDAPPVVSNAPQDARQDGRKAPPQDAPTIAQGAAAERAPERAAEPVEFHSAARAGEVALQSGDFAGAAAAYEAALAARQSCKPLTRLTTWACLYTRRVNFRMQRRPSLVRVLQHPTVNVRTPH